jgi:hypothetical protein
VRGRGLLLWSAGAFLAPAWAGVARAQVAPPPRESIARALVARGDTMMLAGRLFGAESAYSAAVHYAPYDGDTRLALGRYWAGRGRLWVAATLMEEARHFGSDPKVVAESLAPVYAQLGVIDSLGKRKSDWAALAALPAPAVGVGERLRAEYLHANPPRFEGPDSAIVLYTVTDSHLLGRIRLLVGEDTLFAVIDARVRGILLDTAWLRRDSLRRFAPRGVKDAAAVYGVAPRVQIGEITIVNAPVRFQAMRTPRDALIGLDVFGALATTFDPRVGWVMLRRAGRVSDSLSGWRIPTFSGRTGVLVVKGETMFPIGHPDVQQYFRAGKWTWDARRGQVVVDSVGVAPDSTKSPAS